MAIQSRSVDEAPPRCRTRWALRLALPALLLPCCGTGPDDAARLARDLAELQAEARALVRAGGCATSEECAVAAVGAKACGGPSSYWVYCRTTTDEAALLKTLEEARLAEERLNRLRGAMSDCSVVTPPAYRAVDGVCVVVSP